MLCSLDAETHTEVVCFVYYPRYRVEHTLSNLSLLLNVLAVSHYCTIKSSRAVCVCVASVNKPLPYLHLLLQLSRPLAVLREKAVRFFPH